ncbi:hypothetical protein [Alteribacillus iranensis]|uniref:RES domain-containing protein n=1 Tax=Alteribacillus iranensis TaxID=930128 RepID=A0A1I2DMD7_9BACI|nr:hypothetical protein [Alteribacillus iranensis]SFE81617.1 hypothetical protein SAMN05192532_104165 [Alteribacillus iranensis]
MKRLAYRGISFNEGQSVIADQRYKRDEPRDFQNGIKARSVFGSGIYLINDIELVSYYAFCHAELENDPLAMVLRQELQFKNPFILNYNFTEERLRRKALNWKYGKEARRFIGLDDDQNSIEKIKKMGDVIKEYLIQAHYDGIIYHINDEIIYYVSYFQDEQIQNIECDFFFKLEDLTKHKAVSLREDYKKAK